MQTKKCCLHCPGTWVSSQRREEHDCNLPTYIKGNLKLSSLKKYELGDVERSERLRGNPEKPPMTRKNSCYDRFAIAKKFHSENLQHQPLPDKVDDRVFRNVKATPERYSETSLNHIKSNGNSNFISQHRLPIKNCHKLHADIQYAPALGCKTPATNMDLAICWEAPPDPCYEPPWPAHIDGSKGYPAPAIFTRVEHENQNDTSFKSPMERFEAKFCNVKNRCDCKRISHDQDHNCQKIDNKFNVDDHHDGNDDDKCLYKMSNGRKCRSNIDLCRNLDAIHLSEDHRLVKPGYLSNPRRRQPVHLRNCSPCECRGDRTKRFRSRSIHGVPVNSVKKNNGLPNKLIVPRPRTPYARRDYCIDTLTPPFSIVDGCRDGDYPEHWRLTTVYQQSYRNPRKRIGAIVY